MSRHITAMWMAALLTGVLAAGQAGAQDGKSATAKAKPAAKTSAPAKTSAAGKPVAAAKTTPATTAAPDALTGCLRADGGRYMLTDLEGKQAPKRRSWKTAFITKSSKDVEVAGASAAVKLKDQVGHKVTVMGIRDGETHMKAQSIKQLARSCS